MRHRLPSLSALRAFEAAARRGSMTLAAEELSVSPGAVSRHISLLESHFNCRLFRRKQRGIELTDKGHAFHAAIAMAFDRIDDACIALMGQGGDKTLRLSFYPTLTSEWLLPRLPAFRALHPDIDLSLDASLRRINFETDSVDIAMVTGKQTQKELHQQPLFSPLYFPVCSPTLPEQGPPLRAPEDLSRHTLLYSASQLGNWRRWLSAAGVPEVDVEGGLMLENSTLAFKAAREGSGIALGQQLFVTEDLLSGRLIAPFDLSLRSSNRYYMACLDRKKDDGAIAAFRNWLADEILATERRSEALLPGLLSNVVSGNLR